MNGAFKELMGEVALFFDVAGVATILLGFVAALVRSAAEYVRSRLAGVAYGLVRSIFGRSVLLGLEFLVAADLIRTVAIEPTLANLYVLGLLVLIRTFLSFSLDVELEGVWPWQKRRIEDDEEAAGLRRLGR